MLKNKSVIIALLMMVTLAGCVGPLDNPLNNNNTEVDGENAVDAIPQNANSVAIADPVGLLQDPTTREIGNHVLQEVPEEGQETEFDNYDQFLNDSFQQVNDALAESFDEEEIDVELQIEDFGRVVTFAEVDENITQQGLTTTPGLEDTDQEVFDQYGGVIIELELGEEDLDEIFNTASEEIEQEEGVEYTKEQYQGFPIYTVDDGNVSASLSVIDDGLHVLGTTEAVEDSIDTYRGDAEGVDESLVPDAGENTYISVAANDLGVDLEGTSQNTEALEEDPTLESYSLSYSTDGSETMTISTAVSFESTDTASTIEEEATTPLEEFRTQLEQANQTSEQQELLESLIGEEAVSVERDGQTITTDVSTTTDDIEQLIDLVVEGQGVFGGGAVSESDSSTETEVPEGPEIEVDTNATAGPQLTVEVTSNENVEALEVRSGEEVIDENLLDGGEGTVGSQTYDETDGLQDGDVVQLIATVDGRERPIDAVFLPEGEEAR